MMNIWGLHKLVNDATLANLCNPQMFIRSYESQLLLAPDDLALKLDKGGEMGTFPLDFWKVFNKVLCSKVPPPSGFEAELLQCV